MCNMIFRTLLYGVIAATLCMSSGCVGPVAGVFPAAAGQPRHPVYVVNHGWHTGLVVATDDLAPSARPAHTLFDQAEYVELGWGDEGFYRTDGITAGLVVRAVFVPTKTVLHTVAIDEDIASYFSGSGIIKVELSDEGLHRMNNFISASYQQDEQGQPVDLGPGLYGASRYYRAKGHYYFPNTCNKWTARALRSAGCPISTFYAVRAQNVFRQASAFGEVLQAFQK